MEHLIEKYIKKPEYVKELFDHEVSISLKIDGSAFQIYYDKYNISYHKRSGNSKSLGQFIDEYDQLMRKNINDAIDYFNKRENIIRQYKFYSIEIFNDSYILLNVIDHNNNQINEYELKEISKELNIDCVPIVFNGIIEDKTKLIDMMNLSENTTNDEFKVYLFDLFGNGEYQKFLNGDEVEGIVLTWNIDNNIIQYKIINPAFKRRHDEEIKKNKEDQENEIKELKSLYELLYNTLKNIGKYQDDNWITNLDINFLNLLSDESFKAEFKEINKNIKPRFKSFFTLQIDKVSDEIKEAIKDDNIKFLYEKYLRLFFKQRKRNYIISKEFQDNINELIENIKYAKSK